MSRLAILAVACLLGVALLTSTGAAAVSVSTPTPQRSATPPATITATASPPTPGPSPTALPPAPTAAPSATTAPLDPPELRGVWVDAFHDGIKTPAQVDDLVSWARQANVNAVFVQVRRRGDAYYARSREPRTEDPDLQPDFDPLQYLIDRAHQGPQRLQVHAWLATLPIWLKRDTPPSDPKHPFNLHGFDDGSGNSWLMLRSDGAAWAGQGDAGMYYLDPGNPAVARYTADVAADVVRSYDVDGIHLDQVRYYEGDAGTWGYNPTSVARFNQLYGRDPLSQPEPDDPLWAAWRREQVTALVRRVALEVKAVKPSVALTAAVVGWGKGPDADPAAWRRTAPYTVVFQDWEQWLLDGIVDYVVPMDYYREADPQASWFDTWTSWQTAHRGQRGVVLGVGTYLNDSDGAMAQLHRARALGPLGVALYSYAVPWKDGSNGTADGRGATAAWLRGLFLRPAPIPDLPWQGRPVSGLLVDVPGHENAQVRLEGPAARQWATDGTGAASGTDLLPGDYWLTVTAPDVDPAPVWLHLIPGRTTVLRFTPRPSVS